MLRPEVAQTMRRLQPQFEQVHAYFEDPARFLRLMDAEGAERACLINYVAPDVMGFTPGVNPWVHEYARDHRDRLVPFGGFHPPVVRNAKQEVETLLSTYEVGGVKIHPPHQLVSADDFRAGGGALLVLYEACEREGVPVLIHTGTSVFPGALNKYGDPMAVDEVAVRFPKLKIILAHGGRPLWTETAQFLVRRHSNVWMDVSGVPPRSLLEYFPKLEALSEKVLFGSDWPGPQVPGMRANAEVFDSLPISAEAKRRILRDNARSLFGR